MLYGFIVGCEIAFWVLLLVGLVSRYVLRQRKLSNVLLVGTPLADLALLVATILDLQHGTEVSGAHGLAAVYLGVSVSWGKQIIRWADERFAHRFAGGPTPTKKPTHGKEHAAYERSQWLHHLLAWLIGSALIGLMILMINDSERSEPLIRLLLLWTFVLAVDFVISFSYTLSPRSKKK